MSDHKTTLFNRGRNQRNFNDATNLCNAIQAIAIARRPGGYEGEVHVRLPGPNSEGDQRWRRRKWMTKKRKR